MTVARSFTEWAWSLQSSSIPVHIKERAALHVLDGIGTALAAARLGSAPYAVGAAAALGVGEESTVFGSSGRSTAAAAALANGILMHSLDYDDTHTSGLVHATAVTLPAALATAERGGVTGAEFLKAIVIGYELVGRLSTAVPHGFHAKGFHATAVCGAFSSTLVSSLLSTTTVDVAVNALGIAGSQAAGSMEFLATGASTKQIHPGLASMSGVLAGVLAAGGAVGPDSVIEGRHGLYSLYAQGEPDIAGILADLGDSWEAEGIEIKLYPACHLIHRTLDVARALRTEVDVDEIEEVKLRIPHDSIPIICAPSDVKQRPRSPYEAKFSAQWSVAAMMLEGEVGVETYRPDRIDRAEVLELAQRVTCVPTGGQGPAAEQPGDITLRLRDGRELRRSSADLKAATADRWSLKDQVITKFRNNVGVSEELADELVSAVLEVDEAKNLETLSATLRRVPDEWAAARPTSGVESGSTQTGGVLV